MNPRSTPPILAAAIAAAGFSLPAASAAVFSDVSLGAAGPGGLAFSVFVTGPTTLSASNAGTLFSGNVGLAAGASTNFSGGGAITGALYKDPTASVQSDIASQMNISGGVLTQALSQATADAVLAWQNAISLSANLAYNTIGSSPVTIVPSGNANAAGGVSTVVRVQSINITNPAANLTINGGLHDWYIINVAGDITVSNGQITTSGGIPASHILFTLGGSTSSVNLTNASSLLTGTYLAPNASQQINLTPGTVNGAVIGYTVHTSSGPQITGNPWSAVPSPAPACLLALGGGFLGSRRRRTAA